VTVVDRASNPLEFQILPTLDYALGLTLSVEKEKRAGIEADNLSVVHGKRVAIRSKIAV
jgi:hypothetical protein